MMCDVIGKNNRKTSSRLVIASVEKSDSGNYTCRYGVQFSTVVVW